MAQTQNGAKTAESETEASSDQAIERAEATDRSSVIEALPADVEADLTKRAFSPGSLRKILRDSYYLGPIGVGRGGWVGAYGNGQPGTEMRRPDGALYNFPRSWRYAALERALSAGLITYVGESRGFATTERGAALLRRIDVCTECGRQRVPMIEHTYHTGNPNTDGHIETHRLTTRCPDCGTDGYAHGTGGLSYEPFHRESEYAESVFEYLSDIPDVSVYGDEKAVDMSTLTRTPDTDEAAIEDLLDEVVENQTTRSPRSIFGAHTEDLYEREVVTIDSSDGFYRFAGTDDALAVSRTDEEGEVHFTVEDDRLRVNMSYETAVEEGAKDAIKNDTTQANWTGDHWTIQPDGLCHAVCVLAGFEDYYGRWEVTATEEAAALCEVPLVGIDDDGALI